MLDMVLNTCYKGKRSYIQSSDVYTEATNVIKRNYGEDCWILHISFRGFIHNQVTLLTEQKDNNGTIKVKIKDKVLTLFMVESNKKVNCYKNDDDYKIKKICTIDKSIIGGSVKYCNMYNPMQLIVFLTKYIHTELITSKSKWIVSQIDIFNAVDDLNIGDIINVKIVNNLANKFTLSDIVINNTKHGSIRFMAL